MTNARFGRTDLGKRAAARRFRLSRGEAASIDREPIRQASSRALAAAAALCVCLGTMPAQGHATGSQSWHALQRTAFQAGAPVPVASGFSVASASGPSGTPLPLRVVLPENAAATYSFLMFRNLPARFRLSAGFGTKTYWAVSLNDIQGLQIVPPDGYAGTLELEVLLVRTMGSDPERTVASVTFQPNPNSGRVLTATPADGAVTAALPDAVPPKPFAERLPAGEPEERAQRHARTVEEPPPATTAAPARPVGMTEADRAQMDRGDVYLRQGDVASARLIYRQLARKDIAEGAYAMASTYDPEYLDSLGVRGLKPDIAEARKWYEKAQSLGSQQAARRLAVLGQR